MPIPISPEITQGPQITRIDRTISHLPRSVYVPISELNVEAWVTSEPEPFADRRTGTHQVLKVGDVWGKLWDCAWFHFTGTVPAEAGGNKIVLLIDFNGEGCVVDRDGTPVQGLTPVRSSFDYSLGRPGKRIVPFSGCARGGETVDLWVDAGNNDLFGRLPNGGALAEAHIAIRRDEVQALCFDFEVLRDLLNVLPKNKARYARILQSLFAASLRLPSPGSLPMKMWQRRARCSLRNSDVVVGIRHSRLARSVMLISILPGCGPCAKRSAKALGHSRRCFA